MTSTFASLSHPNYRWWFAGSLVANIGTWMQRVAQDWLVLTSLTDTSVTAVGIVVALQFGPVLLFSIWAGVLADRFPRRHLLMVTQVLMGLLAIGLGLLVLQGVVQVWHVYLFAGLLGVVGAFDNPARVTFAAELVPPRRLANAVGLNGASFNAGRLVGPGIAGILLGVVGPGWVFIINGITFGCTIVALMVMNKGTLQQVPSSQKHRGQIRECITLVRRRSDLMAVMIVVSSVSALALHFPLTSAAMARVEFSLGPREYGLFGTLQAVGSLTGALLAARRERPRVRLVLGSAIVFGISMAGLAVMPTPWAFALMCIPVGMASLSMMTAANSTIQLSVEPQMRGRVMSLYMLVLLGGMPIGAPLIGWIADTWGPRWSIGIGALVSLTVAMSATIWAARRWKLALRWQWRPKLRFWIEPRGPHAIVSDALL